MIGKIVQKFREGGLSLLSTLLVKNVSYVLISREERRFDDRYGVDTASPIYRPDLKLSHEHERFGTSYHPTTVSALKRIFARLRIDYPNYQFIEFGAGKGRVVLWAARLPFARVVGVEYSDILCEAATRNVAQVAGREEFKAPIEIRCVDAAEFAIPRTPCVFYFYNPFTNDVARKVFDNIAAARAGAPRRDIVVWLMAPDPAKTDLALPESCGFRVERHLFVRDTWGVRRDVYIMAAREG